METETPEQEALTRFRAAVDALLASAKPAESPPGAFKPRVVADLFFRDVLDPEADQHTWRLRFWREGFYRWTGTHYAHIITSELSAHLSAFLESRKWILTKRGEVSLDHVSVSRTSISNVLQSIEGRTVLSSRREPPMWIDGRPATDLLVFRNGVLDVKTFCEACASPDPVAVDLARHSADLFTLNAHDYDFDPAADCPRWQKFLDEVLPDQNMQAVLAQWAGYCLIPSQAYQKVLVMVGEGENGKSVIMEVFRELVGAENCAAVPLEQLHEPHALAPLVGKLLNQATEWGYIDQVGIMTLKAVSGGDAVTINPKFKSQFEAMLPTRFMVSTNQTPRVSDPTDALWRRLMIMPFTVQIPKDRQVPKSEFVASLCEELPGIAVWALAGLVTLREAGRFEVPASMQAAADETRAASNPAATFCDDRLNVTPGASAGLNAVYEAYRAYCDDGGYKPLHKNHLSSEISRWYRRKTAQEVVSERRAIEGRRCRFFCGVALG